MCAKKDYIWNPSTCPCENVKYLGGIIGDTVITCDDIIELVKSIPTKTVPEKPTPTNFN